MAKPKDVSVRELEALLILGMREQTFPGAVVAAGRLLSHGQARVMARGGVLAPGEAEVELATPYDLASLTKPIVAMAALRLAQQGVLDLSREASRWLPELEGTPGGDASLTQLLSHRAGLIAWAPLWQEGQAPFGSAERKQQMLRSAATMPTTDAHQGSLYSDLGYLILGEVIARATKLPLEQVVRREVTGPLGIEAQLYFAAALSGHARETLIATVAPTELCPPRTWVARGEVHDENGYAFGGIAGHAGMFGTAAAVLAFGLEVLSALEGRSRWLDQGLLRWALRARGQGGHAVGWDTKSAEGSSAGNEFSALSFGHLGFTGTSLWCDPTRRLCAVLLSNRVHPSRENIAIRGFRPRFHDAVAELAFTEAV